MNGSTKFCLLLKQLRANAGLTQRQVAKALNMDRSTYAYYETGSTHPSCVFVMNISKLYNIDYSVFMEAIGDTDFNDSEDGNGFTTLSDTSAKAREVLYCLTRNEQDIILAYRLMSVEHKVRLSNFIETIQNT